MKKIFFFLLFSGLIWGQKTETINLSKSIKDSRNSVKSFTVIDLRADQDVGMVMYHKDEVKIGLENNASKDLQDWFYKYNPVRGQNDLFLVLENLKISEDKKEKYSIGKLELRASTFLKKEDGYHFIDRKDTIVSASSLNTPYMGQTLAKRITLVFTDLLKKSYETTPWELSVSENDLPNYSVVLKDQLDILKADELKEGAYTDYYSFFTHNPEPGYSLQTNSKGIVTKAVKGDEKKGIRKFYAFVHNGTAYKNIPVGYTEIFKNGDGVFIQATKADLFPQTAANGAMIGGAAGGLVGAIVGAVIDASILGKKSNVEESQIYLDPFTGNYLLPESFGKTR
ncbi:hypothetical protein [Chryseobacterium pennipullorum]|uniref:Glycine zipper family protein n=1 Tax=Chryseobacterium pennipullorum TaxID=2258963 RepID=A0A3D9ATT5_9FLAO|nr:hypothetical protein [Chryseobacterium pennipullorum]REC44768.1 hypothetical protein DRF67_16995 [Chryseobacterium pennipullorum]